MQLVDFAAKALLWVGLGFLFLFALATIAIVVMFVIDRTQTADAIRRNYPVIGRFRHLFTELGEFFRQYFFAMDREELPFNRAQRNWVDRAASGKPNTVAFGSTRNLFVTGTPIFVNAAFPPLGDEVPRTQPLRIGPTARHPYDAPSLFNISGMSFGAISRPAVKALAGGAAKAGIWMNTGEGGLTDWHLAAGCDLVFQIGTAKYGVRTPEGRLSDERLRAVAAHEQVRMFELKLAQGAKPGKGGILPGAKVTEEIARIRGIPPGRDSISPNRHPEIDDVGDLLDMVGHIREVTGKPCGIKTVISDLAPLRELLEEVRARGAESAPDFITVDSGDGGTGASPMPLMDLVGVSIRENLPDIADVIEEFNLRDRIRLIASGKLINPGDVAWAIAAGADFVTNARGFMFSIGCIQAMRCNRNTCPTGITTHDPRLQKGLVPMVKADKVANYARRIIEEVEVIAHSVGVSEPRQISRHHVRIMQDNGRSLPMSEIWPGPQRPNA